METFAQVHLPKKKQETERESLWRQLDSHIERGDHLLKMADAPLDQKVGQEADPVTPPKKRKQGRVTLTGCKALCMVGIIFQFLFLLRRRS